MGLGTELHTHERKVYSLFAFMGDTGGLLDALLVVCAFLLSGYPAMKLNQELISDRFKVPKVED